MGAPSVVAKAETKSVPFFGSLIRYVMPTPKTGLLVKKSKPPFLHYKGFASLVTVGPHDKS